MAAVKQMVSPKAVTAPASALVYCPICTHHVHANVTMVTNAAGRKVPKVVPGQRCERCASPVDAAYVVRMDLAA